MTARQVFGVVGVFGLALAMAGCPLPNPCRFGTTREGNRCVAPPDGSTGDDGDGATEQMPPTDDDASPQANDERDADAEADAEPQGADLGAADHDGGEIGAEAGPGEDVVDAASDGGGDSAAACDAEDLALWRNFQLSGRMVLAMSDCNAELPCAVPWCGLDACMREAAGASGCETCIANEMSCIAARCAGPCAASDAFDSCRKCACDNACMGAATGCGSSELDVCVDCMSGTCQTISTDPSIVMQIFNYGRVVAPLIP